MKNILLLVVASLLFLVSGWIYFSNMILSMPDLKTIFVMTTFFVSVIFIYRGILFYNIKHGGKND